MLTKTRNANIFHSYRLFKILVLLPSGQNRQKTVWRSAFFVNSRRFFPLGPSANWENIDLLLHLLQIVLERAESDEISRVVSTDSQNRSWLWGRLGKLL